MKSSRIASECESGIKRLNPKWVGKKTNSPSGDGQLFFFFEASTGQIIAQKLDSLTKINVSQAAVHQKSESELIFKQWDPSVKGETDNRF